MKLTAVLLSGFFAAATMAAADGGAPAQLAEVRSVYVLPMSKGMDQHLASHLARLGIFQIVTDPAKADAVLTSSLGDAFERKMEELYPPPKPVQPEAKKAEDNDRDDSEPPKFAEGAPLNAPSTFARGKGTLFMVSTRDRTVLWSTFEKPSRTDPEELDRTAGRIAKRLERDLKRKPAQ